MANKISSIKLPNNSVYDFKDNGALQLTGGTVTGPVNFNNSISAIDITTGDFIATGNASFTNPINGKIKVAESLPVGPIEVGGYGFTKAFKKTLLMCLGRSSNIYTSFIHGTTAPTIEGQKIGTFFSFQINAPILYQDQADYEDGSIIPAGVCKTTAENIDIRYMFNVDENWGITGKPLYLVGRYQRYDSDSHYFYIGNYDMGTRPTLCTNTIPVEDPPYGSDTTAYLYLGQMTSSYQFTLSNIHPLYTYKGGMIAPLNTKKLTLDDISEPLHGGGSQNGSNFVRKYYSGNLYVDRNHYLQSNQNTSDDITSLKRKLDNNDDEIKRLFATWHNGLESTILYQRGPRDEDQEDEEDDNYYTGSYLRWGGSTPYLYMLRHKGYNWATSDWEKISAGYADSAGTATKWTSAQKVYVALGTASTTTSIQGGNPNAQTIGVNGVLKVANGGTNISSYAVGDLLYANGTTSLQRLPGNSSTTRKFLTSAADVIDGVSAPYWSTLSKIDVGLEAVENTKLSTWKGSTYITTLGTITTGTWNGTTIAVAQGGTGKTTFPSGELLIGNGTNAIGTRAIDTSLSAGTTSTNLPTSKAVVDYIGTVMTSAVTFKGTVGTGGNFTTLPSFYKVGWAYRVITAGTYAGQVCEIGDLIVAIKDSSSSSSNSDWTVIQNNIDGAITESGGTINGTLTVDNSFYANSATLGNLIVNGTSSFVDNMQVNSINGVTVGASPKFTDTTYSNKAAVQNGTEVSLVTTGQKYTWNSKTSNTGTVTSVQIQASSPLQSSTSTAQTNTLNTTISFIKQNANTVLAGPSSGSTAAAPSFRALVASDIPNLTVSKISDFPTSWALSSVSGADDLKAIEALSGTSGFLKKTAANTWTLDTNTYVTSSGVTSITLTGNNGVSVTNSGTAITTTGTRTISLADNYGDTKNPYASKTKNYVLAAPNGSNGVPSFRALVGADLPLATTAARGGIQIGYSSTGQKYAVQLSNEKAYVEVPWVNTTYSLTITMDTTDTKKAIITFTS